MGRDVSTSQAWVAGVEGCTSHCERVGWEQGGHTKALWAQEGHRRPSEVPRAIPHQNGQNSRQILKSAPTHTRTYVHTHTRAHTQYWGLVFTGTNSLGKGRVVPGQQCWEDTPVVCRQGACRSLA